MENNSEYENLLSQKYSAESRYNATQNRIEDYEYRIKRLKAARDIVADQKTDFRNVKRSDKGIIDAKQSGWRGQTYQDYCAKGNEMTLENDRYCQNTLDAALDALNNEITLLQNEKLHEYGILGDLASWINSLINKIDNFLN